VEKNINDVVTKIKTPAVQTGFLEEGGSVEILVNYCMDV
jgi:hypothetical protein